MYAVVFELDTNCLNECYEGETYHGAYREVRDFMSENGFSWTQGSVYFGNETVDAVKCVLVIQKMARTFPWFQTCVRDIRMLRIEENNDLLPAIKF
jgi:virulence-associated protein 2